MTKKQSIGLWIIVGIVILALLAYLLRGALHEPARPDQSDSLEIMKNIAKQRADSFKIESQSEKQKSDEALNSPVTSAYRDSLWTVIRRNAKEDSIRRSVPGHGGKTGKN